MAFFSRYSRALIGIDIEPARLRLVQLRKSKSQWLVERMAMTTLNEDIFIDCKINNWEALSVALKGFVDELNLVGGIAALHLPAHLVRMQRMKLTRGLRYHDIEAEIYAEVLKDLPGSQESLSIDYRRIRNNEDDEDIFFVAAKQAYVSKYVMCVNGAGLHPKIIDIDIFALKRAITFSLPTNQPRSKREFILYAYHHHAILMAFDDEMPAFFKHWEIDNPHDFLQAFNNHLQLSLTILGEVSRIILCADKSLCELIENELAQRFIVDYPDPLSHDKLLFASSIDESFVFSHGREFMLAFGLALRECPKW